MSLDDPAHPLKQSLGYLRHLGDGVGGWRLKEEAESHQGNTCKCVVYALVYTWAFLVPTAADCSRITWPCPEVTRDSLDFNCSLRELSCLLQKHRLRYTIKLPSPVRGLMSLLSLFLLLLPSCHFLSAFLARSLFSFYSFFPIGWLSRHPPVLLSLPLLSWYTT